MKASRDAERGYQFGFSDINPKMFDEDSRTQKARKILAVLKDALGGRELGSLRVLDVGASTGIIAGVLGREFGEVVGIDIDEGGLADARRFLTGPNQELLRGDAMNMEFEDASFDVVVLNHVYEHVPDANRLFDEVWRVLRPGGIAYVGAPNRLGPIEPHHKLLGLSWLPPRAGDVYVRLLRKGDSYYERLRTYWGLKRLTAGFEFEDWTTRVLRDPARYAAEDLVRPDGPITKLPNAALAALHPFIPTYILILRKAVDAQPGRRRPAE